MTQYNILIKSLKRILEKLYYFLYSVIYSFWKEVNVYESEQKKTMKTLRIKARIQILFKA